MSEKNKTCAIFLITMLTITILFTTAVSAQFDEFYPGEGAGGGGGSGDDDGGSGDDDGGSGDEPSCTPSISCREAECGTVPDGCGGYISCGSCPSDGWTCSGSTRQYKDYTCSGRRCTYTITQSENCNNLDGWYCSGDTRQYRDYGCSGGSCTYSVTQSYNCNNDDGWYCYADYLASTVRAAKRIYFCDYGYCDYNWDVSTFYDCDNDDGLYCYSGNRIYYRDYGCTADPTKKCTYSESFIEDCDDKDGWYCYADVYRYQDYSCGNGQCGYSITQSTKDGDYSSGACSCLSTGYWNIGGEVSAEACCGDDANEYRIICKTSGANQGATC